MAVRWFCVCVWVTCMFCCEHCNIWWALPPPSWRRHVRDSPDVATVVSTWVAQQAAGRDGREDREERTCTVQLQAFLFRSVCFCLSAYLLFLLRQITLCLKDIWWSHTTWLSKWLASNVLILDLSVNLLLPLNSYTTVSIVCPRLCYCVHLCLAEKHYQFLLYISSLLVQFCSRSLSCTFCCKLHCSFLPLWSCSWSVFYCTMYSLPAYSREHFKHS